MAYLLSDMMADVIRRGTGVGARVLNRDDLAGKTGTTNDFHDAWFTGFNGDLVASVWTGFDQDRSLGEGEQGARAALPIWIYFMHQALAGAPRRMWPMPDGLVTRTHFARHWPARKRGQSQRHHGKIHRGKSAQVGSLRRTEQYEFDERWR